MLNIIIIKVEPKIIILLFLVKELKADVMKDLSVSLRPISLSEASRLIKDGNNKNVTKCERLKNEDSEIKKETKI